MCRKTAAMFLSLALLAGPNTGWSQSPGLGSPSELVKGTGDSGAPTPAADGDGTENAEGSSGSSAEDLAGSAGELDTIPVAEPTPQMPVGQGDERPTDQLAEVIVTAQHRIENAQKAAVPLDVVDGSDLQNAGIVDVARLTEKVPALVSNGISNFVRGVGTFSQLGYTDPAVAFNYDGIYIGRSTSTVGMFYDLQRIELLKGPQGTLYGRNATGGALNVLPEQPHIGESSGFLNAGYGNYDFYNVEGAINAPVGDSSAVRLSMLMTRNSGFNNDGTADKDIKSIRLQGKSELSDDLTVRLAGDYSHIGGVGGSNTYVGSAQYNNQTGQYDYTPSGFSPSEGLFSNASQAFRTNIFLSQAGRNFDPLSPYPYSDNDYYGVNAEATWTTAIGTLTLIPAYRYYKSDVVVGESFTLGSVDTGKQESVEARLAAEDVGIFDYTAGLFYYHEVVDSDGAVNQSAVYARQYYESETTSGAAFAQLRMHVTDAMRLVGGLRYTKDDKNFSGATDGLAMVCTLKLVGIDSCPAGQLFEFVRTPEEQPFAVPARGGLPTVQIPGAEIVIRQFTEEQAKLSKGKATYRAALEYDLAKDSLFYVSAESGFRSGGISLAAGHETYKPENILAYTVGIKNRFFGGKAQLNLEAFDWEYKGQQFSHLGADANGNLGLIIQNIGTSRIRGLEVDGKALLWRGMHIGTTVQYVDSVYKDFEYDSPIVDVVPILTTDNSPPPRLGCPSTNNQDGKAYHVNCDGLPGFNSPKWTVNLSASQTIPIGGYIAVISAETQYRTGYFVGFEYLDFEHQDSAWRSQASLSLMPGAGAYLWSISAYVRNIENTRSLQTANSQNNIDSVAYSEPRTYGIKLGIQF
ncbi:TonB-dependent receptor [Solimonas terrae]|uniref:TonB-dependent receptor n=1 Tax=Solimonas terrae TaxID=1396819 RepID=A0A6M2BU69_9GAMM|nr:TonB-dependent receptor [Solimonas terrae]NGY05924.1 TonB-dependent receptor [Solimonas terrae]